MIEILILYILNRYDATIYKIQKLIEEKFFAFSKPSLGTINPALKRLEAISAVEFKTDMSDGGKMSKTYSITAFGIKYLKNLLVTFEFKNPGYLLGQTSLCISITDILDDEEKEELLKNVFNHLMIHKIEIEKKLENPYMEFTSIQKDVLKCTLDKTNSLIELVKKQ